MSIPRLFAAPRFTVARRQPRVRKPVFQRSVGGPLIVFLVATTWTAADSGPPFVHLFDGKTLAGWDLKRDRSDKPVEAGGWSVVNGVLTAQPGTGWLSTQKMYGDFVLRLEWRVPVNGNSGVFLRVPVLNQNEQPYVKGVEIQVLDDRGPQYQGKLKPWQHTGSIYGVAAASDSTYTGPNTWNRYEITCRGDDITVVLNGKQVAQANMAKEPALQLRPRRGYIGLQNHGTAAEYRNIEIQVLDK